MSAELTPDEHIKVLQHEIEELKKQIFVLTDKANQALIAGESSNALWIALMEAATPNTRRAVLAGYQLICRQLDASPINAKRTEAELSFQGMLRESMIAHLKRK